MYSRKLCRRLKAGDLGLGKENVDGAREFKEFKNRQEKLERIVEKKVRTSWLNCDRRTRKIIDMKRKRYGGENAKWIKANA